MGRWETFREHRLMIKRRQYCAAFLCGALVFVGFVHYADAGFEKDPEKGAAPRWATIVAVLDGDTVVLDDGSKVRYLGVDTPEMDHETSRHECYAREAYERNKAWVLGRKVTLAYEEPMRDEHGRLLAYVVTPERMVVNAELVRQGLAYVFRGAQGFSKFPQFLALQREAVLARRGMHGACVVLEEKAYIGNRQSFVFHRTACPFGAKTHPAHRVLFSSRWDALMEGFRPCRRCAP